MKVRAAAAVIVLSVIGAACSSTPQDAASSQGTPTSAADEGALPEACSGRGARELVDRFLTAYNDGSGGASLTDEFFAPADRFQGFFDKAFRDGEDATDRVSLDAYFAQRLADGDRLSIVEFSFNGYRAEDDTGHFGIVLSRNGENLMGKGAFDCGSGRIMVWSVGTPAQE